MFEMDVDIKTDEITKEEYNYDLDVYNNIDESMCIDEKSSLNFSEMDTLYSVNTLDLNTSQNQSTSSTRVLRVRKSVTSQSVQNTPIVKKTKEQRFKVKMKFEVPKQHLIESRLNYRPTAKELSEFAKLDVIMKKNARFDEKEDKKLLENYKRFCWIHFINHEKEFLSKSTDVSKKRKYLRLINLPMETRLNFARYIAQGLNRRYLFSVYNRIINLYDDSPFKGKCRRFTKKEDKILLESVERNKDSDNKFKEAANLLQTNTKRIENRYNMLTIYADYNDKNLKWTRGLAEMFLRYLCKYCNIRDIKTLEGCNVRNAIFEKISPLMRLSPAKLQRFWAVRLSSQLFCTQYVTQNSIRIRLITLIYKSGTKSRSDINWKGVATFFHGLTPKLLNREFCSLLMYHVPQDIRGKFKASLKYLYKELIPQLKQSEFDKEFRRCTFSLEDGLRYVDDDSCEE